MQVVCNRDDYERFVQDCLNGKDITNWLKILDLSKYDNEVLFMKLSTHCYRNDKENLAILKILLADSRVTKKINYRDLLYNLCKNDNVLSVEYILNEIKPDFTQDNKKHGENYWLTKCFDCSIQFGAYRCTRLFLHDDRVNNLVHLYGTVLLDWSTSYYNVFHLLWQDPRINPDDNYEYVINAINDNNYDTLCLILSDSRIRIPSYIYGMANNPDTDPSIKRILTEHSFSLDSHNYNKNIIE